MISWLQGEKIDAWQASNKKGILISCGGIGYEIQLISRDLIKTNNSQNITLWVHQIFREDGNTLFGFQEKEERNLFRKIIEINGIGPQIAMSLLEQYRLKDLLYAIKNADIKKLTKASGVGKRIAERLSVELKGKLNEFNEVLDPGVSEGPLISPYDAKIDNFQELKDILRSLNYEEEEINKALKQVIDGLEQYTISENPARNKLNQETFDSCLKEALVLLSQDLSSKGT